MHPEQVHGLWVQKAVSRHWFIFQFFKKCPLFLSTITVHLIFYITQGCIYKHSIRENIVDLNSRCKWCEIALEAKTTEWNGVRILPLAYKQSDTIHALNMNSSNPSPFMPSDLEGGGKELNPTLISWIMRHVWGFFTSKKANRAEEVKRDVQDILTPWRVINWIF